MLIIPDVSKVHTRAYRWVSLDPSLKGSLETPFLRTTLLSLSDGACLVGITGHIDHVRLGLFHPLLVPHQTEAVNITKGRD
jgi:hypothetical protein